jgi:eukaryotic-like serine/threonine-protein kinase
VTLLGQVDAKMVERAVNAAAALSTPQDCADLKRLAQEPPGPMNARNAQAVKDWQTAVQQAKAQLDLGRLAEAEAAAQDVVVQARAAQEPATVASALSVVANAKSFMGFEDQSMALSKQAYTAALAGRHDVQAFSAASDVAEDLSILGKTDEALEWFAVSEGLLERLGSPPKLNAETAAVRSDLHRDGPDSIRLANETVTATNKAWGEGHLKTYNALVNQAAALAEKGRFEESNVLNRKLATLYESAYGVSHPMLALILNNLGVGLQAVGQLDEARAVQQRAFALSLAAFGEASNRTLSHCGNLALTLQKLGRANEAYPLLVKLLEASRPSSSTTPFFAHALARLGWLEFARGDFKAARGAWEEAGRLSAVSLEAQSEYKDGLGQLELSEGRPEQAVPLLERALALREESHTPIDDIAMTRFALAKALNSTRQGKARACSLLEKAEQELKAFPFRHRELEQVQSLRAQLERPLARE